LSGEILEQPAFEFSPNLFSQALPFIVTLPIGVFFLFLGWDGYPGAVVSFLLAAVGAYRYIKIWSSPFRKAKFYSDRVEISGTKSIMSIPYTNFEERSTPKGPQWVIILTKDGKTRKFWLKDERSKVLNRTLYSWLSEKSGSNKQGQAEAKTAP